jgi:RNA polymerase sigma factor (TIGR02999 family)
MYQAPPQWESRGHLLGIAAHARRQALIDHARRRKVAKRPQDRNRVQLTEIAESLASPVEADDLAQALDRLATLDARQANTVEMRFFVGLTGEQISPALGVSSAIVQREWRMARAWLRRELQVE